MMQLLTLSKGNPGAMQCLIGMTQGDIQNSVAGLTILPKLEELEIKGTDLYVLWSDISNKDYQLMRHLCEVVPSELLKEASSKQDYSGRVTLKKYIQSYRIESIKES